MIGTNAMKARMGHGEQYEQLDDLEQRLRGTLRPVVPSRDLLHRLQERIHIPDASELTARLRDWQTLWLVLVGALSGALLLITLARAMFHLTGRRGLRLVDHAVARRTDQCRTPRLTWRGVLAILGLAFGQELIPKRPGVGDQVHVGGQLEVGIDFHEEVGQQR